MITYALFFNDLQAGNEDFRFLGAYSTPAKALAAYQELKSEYPLIEDNECVIHAVELDSAAEMYEAP